jgi:formylglycine-generating enzyme required for sulfatase activity
MKINKYTDALRIQLVFKIIGAFAMLLTPSVLIAQSVDIALCYVGYSGNAPDPATGYGRVGYDYCIAKFDITETQYAAFLNAVAQTDKYKLYSPKMAKSGNFKDSGQSDDDFHTNAGITRSGEFGSYVYSVLGTSGSDPVVWVTWFDAARFCNWLHNGQPKDIGEREGSTETGAYTLSGDRSQGNEQKNPGAKFWIPTENEWYKAAYYDPQLNGGNGGYWRYPTRSDTAPGNVIGGGSNEANYIVNGFFSVTVAPHDSYTSLMTPVGSFTGSFSYFGTYDQGGDVAQWNDALVSGKLRGLRGGCWNSFAQALESSARGYDTPSAENGYNGFRIASVPQKPSTK